MSAAAQNDEFVRVQREDFSVDAEINRVRSRSKRIGGISIFLGAARDYSKGREVDSITFEHYEGMAQKKLREIRERALKDFDIRRQLEMTARANFDAQSQTHGLVLSLMEARNHSDLARRLNEEVRHRFGLVAATIALEDTGAVPLGWKTLDYGGVDYIIGETGLSLLGPDGVCRVLFDDDVKRVKSAAVLRIATR